MSGLLPLKNIPTITDAQRNTPNRVFQGEVDHKVFLKDVKYTTDKVMKTIYTGDYAKNYKFIVLEGMGHWISVDEQV